MWGCQGMDGMVVDKVVDREQFIKSLGTSPLLEAFSLSGRRLHRSAILLSDLLLQRLHRRPRNSVAVQVVVDVNQNTRISPLIEGSRARTARHFRA